MNSDSERERQWQTAKRFMWIVVFGLWAVFNVVILSAFIRHGQSFCEGQ